MLGKRTPRVKSTVHKTVDDAKKATALHKAVDDAQKAAVLHKIEDDTKKAVVLHKAEDDAKKAAALHKTADGAKKAVDLHKAADDAKKAATVHKPADDAKKAATVHKPADDAKKAATVHKPADDAKKAATVHKGADADGAKKPVDLHKAADDAKEAATLHKTAVDAKKVVALHKTADDAKKAATVHTNTDDAKKAAAVQKTDKNTKNVTKIPKTHSNATNSTTVSHVNDMSSTNDKTKENLAVTDVENAGTVQKMRSRNLERATENADKQDAAKTVADTQQQIEKPKTPSQNAWTSGTKSPHDNTVPTITTLPPRMSGDVAVAAQPIQYDTPNVKEYAQQYQAGLDSAGVLSLGRNIQNTITNTLASTGPSGATNENSIGELVPVDTTQFVKNIVTFQKTPQDSSELAEEDSSEMAEEDGSELAEEDSSELAEEDSSELAEEDSSDLAEEDSSELAKEDSSELAEEDSSELAKEDSSEFETKPVSYKKNEKIDSTAFDFLICPEIHLNPVLTQHTILMRDMQEIEMGGGIAIFLAGSILAKMQTNSCVSRLQESMVRMLKNFIYIYKRTEVVDNTTEVVDNTNENATEQAARKNYTRQAMQTENEDKIMHLMYTMTQNRNKGFMPDVDWACRNIPRSTFNNKANAKMVCKNEHMDKARTRELFKHMQNPAISANLRELLCGPQRIQSHGHMFDVFQQLFWTEASDAHICNTVMASTLNADLHVLPDSAPILAKIAHLERNFRSFGDRPLWEHVEVKKKNMQDEIVKWQILSIMCDAVRDYKQHTVREEEAAAIRASQALLHEEEPYKMDARFIHTLRTSMDRLKTPEFAQVAVSLRPMLAFLNTIVSVQDDRLMPVFQHFADEYAHTGGGVCKKYADLLDDEKKGHKPGIIERVRLMVRMMTSSMWLYSTPNNLLGLQSRNMHLFLQYYAVYEHEFLHSTVHRPVHDSQAHDNLQNAFETAPLVALSDAMQAVSMSHFNDIIDPAKSDSVFNPLISSDVKKSFTLVHIIRALCPMTKHGKEKTTCAWPTLHQPQQRQTRVFDNPNTPETFKDFYEQNEQQEQGTEQKNGEETVTENGKETVTKNGEETVTKNGKETVTKNGKETVTKNDTKIEQKNDALVSIKPKNTEIQTTAIKKNTQQQVCYESENPQKGWVNDTRNTVNTPHPLQVILFEGTQQKSNDQRQSDSGAGIVSQKDIISSDATQKVDDAVPIVFDDDKKRDFLDMFAGEFSKYGVAATFIPTGKIPPSETDDVHNMDFQDPDIFLMAQAFIFFIFVTIVMYCCAKEKKSDPKTEIERKTDPDPQEKPITEILTAGNIGGYNMNQAFLNLQNTPDQTNYLKKDPFVLCPEIQQNVHNNVYTHIQLTEKFDHPDVTLQKILQYISGRFNNMREAIKIDILKHLGFINIILKTKCHMTGKLEFINACDSDEEQANWNTCAQQVGNEAVAELKRLKEYHDLCKQQPAQQHVLDTNLELFNYKDVVVSVHVIIKSDKLESKHRQWYLAEIKKNMELFKSKSQDEQKNIILIIRRVLHIVFVQAQPGLYPSVPA